MTLTVREGLIPGIWQYNLNDGTDNRAGCGRIADKSGHMDVLRYAAGICTSGYQPGTVERGLLEQFAATPAPPDSPACGPAVLRWTQPGIEDRTARNELTSCAASADTSAI